jgi:uncharacterized membrane protein YozB (DUF420 family)
MPNQFHRGFLGTAGPFYADTLLTTEIAMGLMLLLGFWLARARKFKWHVVCQTAVVLLNAALIVFLMLPAFRSHVLPKLPARLGRMPYLISTAHAALGTVAESAGIYVLLVAGTDLLPIKLRFRNYKLWMRITLLLWWVALLFGVATYAVWYTQWLRRF